MVTGRKVLREVIRKVVTARFPMDYELALLDSVSNPVKAHVNGFGPFLFDSARAWEAAAAV